MILSLNHSCKDRQYLIGFEWTIYFLVIVVFFKSRCLFEAQSIHMRDVLLLCFILCTCTSVERAVWRSILTGGHAFFLLLFSKAYESWTNDAVIYFCKVSQPWLQLREGWIYLSQLLFRFNRSITLDLLMIYLMNYLGPIITVHIGCVCEITMK